MGSISNKIYCWYSEKMLEYTWKDEKAFETEVFMQYRIVGNTMPAVEILFDQAGESMYTQSGGMVWQSDGIEMLSLIHI